MGLLHIRKVGVQRIMQSEDSPKTLFPKAGDMLLNPIKRTVYIQKKYVGTDLLDGLIAVTCLCAYLLIYNIMYLSLAGKVRYYSLLQTVGMTEKQEMGM